MTINELVELAHTNARNKGFHPDEEPFKLWFANQCNNLHGEVGELWEAFRSNHLVTYCDKVEQNENNKFVMKGTEEEGLSCMEEEIADFFIRAADMFGRMTMEGLTKRSLEQCIKSKHAYNLTRKHKHGKAN